MSCIAACQSLNVGAALVFFLLVFFLYFHLVSQPVTHFLSGLPILYNFFLLTKEGEITDKANFFTGLNVIETSIRN